MNFGDIFPKTYFHDSQELKKEFLDTNIDEECVDTCKKAFFSLVDSCEISDFSKEFIHKCYSMVGSNFFTLPVSTGGKHHGGITSNENCCGGIYHHYLRALKISERVIDRYKDCLNRLSLSEFNNYVEVLRVSILLHDIGRLGPDGIEIFSCVDHGFIGARIVADCFTKMDLPCEFDFYIFPLLYAVENHMELWKFSNAYNAILNYRLNSNPDFQFLLCGLMLSESDFFSTVY